MKSALYIGGVTHRRLRPREHRLAYRVFWLLLDLSELDELDRQLLLFSRNRFNLLSFHDQDHAIKGRGEIREQLDNWLSRAAIDLEGGDIRLLTMPRVLGFVFNPISLYYCHHADGRLMAMAYEVTSTFGVRHAYVIPVPHEDQALGVIRQGAAKALYVSPFMGMEMDYVFRGHVPAERLDMIIDGLDAEGVLINAAMSADRSTLTDGSILRAVLAIPFLTLKVVAAIHWEALKLWVKRIPLTQQPPPAADPVTAQNAPRNTRLH